MGNEEKLKILIEAQNNAQKAFDEANKQISETEQKVKSMSERMDAAGKKAQEVGGKMTKYMTLPILGLGAVAFKAGAELQDAMGAVNQIFDKSSDTVKNWADKLPTYYGIAKTEALQYSSTMGSMLKNIGGLSEEEAAKQSAQLIELSGDLAAMFGGSTADAVRALTGSLKGNNTMLDNYGMSALDAEVKAEAFRKGLMKADVDLVKVEAATIKVDEARKKSNETIKKYGKESDEARKTTNELALAQQGVEEAMAGSTSEMDVATKQAATLSLIMSQTKDVQGQAAREAEGGSGKLRALQTEMKNMSAEIGTKLLPVGIKLLGWAKDIFEGFGKLSPKMQNVILIVAGLGAAMGPVVYIGGTLLRTIKGVTSATKFASKHTQQLAKWTMVHGKSLAGNLKFQAQYRAMQIKENALKVAAKAHTIALTVAEKARMVATKVGIAIQTAFNAVMAINPFILITVAIIALIAIFVTLYKKNEAFRNFVDAAWKKISSIIKWAWENVIKPVWDAIVAVITNVLVPIFQFLWGFIQGVWLGITTAVQAAWAVISVIWNALVWTVTNIIIPAFKFLWGFLQGVWRGIGIIISWVWDNIIKPIWDAIVWYVTEILIPVWTKIFEIARAVWDGIWAAVSTAWGFIKGVFEAIWNFISGTLIPIFQSIWDTVASVFANVWNKIVWVKDKIMGAFDSVKGFIQGLIDKFNTIKDAIGSAFTTVADAILKPFKTAFNGVAELWNSTVGKISFTIPGWIPGIGGNKFSMPKMDKLYKGVRNFSGGAAIVGDIAGRGGEIINMPRGSDVYNNRESKQIMRSLADGNGGGGSVTNMFTGNIVLGDSTAVKEFFAELNKQGERSAIGIPA